MRALFLLLIFSAPMLAHAQTGVRLPATDLTDAQAAAHALNRLAYGPRAGEVDLISGDLARWIDRQLGQSLDDSELDARLAQAYPSTALSLYETGAAFPSPAVRLRAFQAMQEGGGRGMMGESGMRGEAQGGRRGRGRGRMQRGQMGRGSAQSQMEMRQRGMGGRSGGRMPGMGGDSMRAGGGQQALIDDLINGVRPEQESQRARVAERIEERTGFRDLRDLFYDANSSKLERAIHSGNQLEEVLVDFWFNHFNVSLGKINDAGPFVPSFECDAIRPHVLGNFRDMLEATTLHPAMLFYLDNHRSNADADRQTLAPRQAAEPSTGGGGQGGQAPGINENFARELFELHTLGVDGGYTQRDIEEAARVLTGWKVSPLVFPLGDRRAQVERRISRSAESGNGYVFDARQHDAEAKQVMGVDFPAGGGAAELEALLDLVAYHPSTARFLSTKLAQKFVSDTSPDALVDDLARVYLDSRGDLQAVMRVLVEHPAFWSDEAVAGKIKTPLETVASAARAVGADVTDPAELIRWTTRMGQPLYAYNAPTGYPEESAPWVNGAALLNRMNFGIELATGQIAGVTIDLLALNQRREPESAEDALLTYLPILLPGRDTAETAALLMPTLRDPALDARLDAATGEDDMGEMPQASSAGNQTQGGDAPASSAQLAQVVGLILGSPEFQRQ